MIAVAGTFVEIAHRRSRRLLRLQHVPGTLASAISIGAETNLAQLLNSRQEDDFGKTLRNKQFRIDPRTMKIVVEGEDGYDEAVSPAPRTPRQPNSPWGLSGSTEKRKAL